MKLVINASPIIFLVKLELINQITPIFEELIIPNGVRDEILRQPDEVSNWIFKVGHMNYQKNDKT